MKRAISLLMFLVSAQCVASIPNSDWPVYGGDSGSMHYSPLTQITPDNVKNLSKAWVYHSGDFSNGENKNIAGRTDFVATPVLWDKKLYLCTPFNSIVALDAKDGKQLWKFRPDLDLSQDYMGHLRCRGVAVWVDEKAPTSTPCQTRVFEGIIDGRLVAVDARTGSVCKDFGDHGYVDLNYLRNYSNKLMVLMSAAPVIYKDTVIVGSAINDNQYANSPHGIVNAFDARTGKMKWRFDPIPPAIATKTGAANVWAPFSVDNKTGIVYLPTSSPSPDYYGANRTQPIPYENAIVALRAETGKVVWSYQTVHHNLWDYDLPSAPALIEVKRNGKIIPAVAQTTKTNLVFILDRATGKPLFPVEEKPFPASDIPGEVTSPTQPIPTLPKPLNRTEMTPDDAFGMFYLDHLWCKRAINKLSYKGMFTPPSLKGFLEFPGAMGGNNWGGGAYDPNTGLFIVNTSSLAYVIYLFPREQLKQEKLTYAHDEISPMWGTPYAMRRILLMSPIGVPCSPAPWGKLTAIDVSTGEVRWEIPFGGVRKFGFFVTPRRWGSPNLGGPIVTKSGLIFIGASMDNRFHVYNATTGERLWETDLPADGIATPMTYSIDGKQYVVIAAGGGRVSSYSGDSLMAFALPDKK